MDRGEGKKKMEDPFSSMTQQIISPQIGRKGREKREFLWWNSQQKILPSISLLHTKELTVHLFQSKIFLY